MSPYGRRLLGLTSDRNERNRTRLTISSAGTTRTSSTHSRSRPCIWSPNANTEARTTPAAPGLGMPMKYRLSAVGSMVVLNRASRIAAQATHRKQAIQPNGSKASRPRENNVNAVTAGASPKETRSASESNCRPNGVTAPTSRATAPSVMSKSTDRPMNTVARVYSPRIETSIAAKPQNMLPRVNRLGRVARARLRVPRTDPRTNSTVAVRRVGIGIGISSAGGGPAGDDGLATPHPLPLLDDDLALRRQEDVHPGAELHQPHPLTGGQPLADRGAGDDPPREDPDDLPEDDGPFPVAQPQL